MFMARMAFAFCHRNTVTQGGFLGWIFVAMIKFWFSSSVEWSNSSFLHKLLFHAWTGFSESYTYHDATASLLLRKLKKGIFKKSVLSILLFLARKSPHHCSSRSPWADQRQPCPCSIVIPNLFPSISLATQIFFWRPFPLCFQFPPTGIQVSWIPHWKRIHCHDGRKVNSGFPSLVVDCIFCSSQTARLAGLVRALLHEHHHVMWTIHFHLK